jgi:hypothetical protein
MIERRNLYKSALEKVPAPEFIVLYNGTKPYPDQSTLKLSDAFKDASGLRGTLPAAPELELTVKVYNINKGHNADIVRKCGKLNGYSFFVDKVREFEREMTKEAAMKGAIEYCIKHDVLKRFLESNGSEVINMLITEWDTEEAKEVWFEEGRAEGIELGIEKEREATVRNLLQFGMQPEQIAGVLNLPLAAVKRYCAAPE